MAETPERSSTVRLCYAGLSITTFIFLFPCLMVSMFLMEAPWRYLTATQVLYTIVVCLYVFHVLLDLAIIMWSRADLVKFRTALAIGCPVLGAMLTLPTAGMLSHTKSKGGFTSTSADVAMIFSIVVVPIALLHALFAYWLYRAFRNEATCCGFNAVCCCACFTVKSREDRMRLPSAAERGGNLEFVPTGPLEEFQSVEFNPSLSEELRFNRSDFNPTQTPEARAKDVFSEAGDAGGTVPDQIPPPPTVRRVRYRQEEPEYIADVDKTGSLITPDDIDLGVNNGAVIAERTRPSKERTVGREMMRPEDELDYPIDHIDDTQDASFDDKDTLKFKM